MLPADFTIDDLTPTVVTDMLRQRPAWRDISVNHVDAAAVGTGQMASSYRLQITYEGESRGAPMTLVVKIASTDATSRQLAAATGAYLREVRFYQELPETIQTRIPQCYYSAMSDDGNSFVLLLEDMGPARSIDQLSGCDPDQADLALDQAAALHGPSWGNTRVQGRSWLPAEQIWNALGGSIPEVTAMWLERFGPHLTDGHAAVIEQLGSHVGMWLHTLTDHRGLWHGDFRLDNLLFDAQAGRTPIAVVDWQSVAVGPGIIDVSYFLGNSMTSELRAVHERDLVAEYHRRLVAHGVTDYSMDRCWHEYRAHAVYGLVLTVPVSLGVASTPRGDAMFAAMAGRAADQILANDSFAAVRAL